MQPQVGVGGVDRLVRKIGDHGADGHHLDAPIGVRAGQGGQLLGNVIGREPGGAGRAIGAQFRLREPGVEDGALGGDGGQSETRGRSHGSQPY